MRIQAVRMSATVLGVLLLGAALTPAMAAVKTWTGTANDGLWANNANWGGASYPNGSYYNAANDDVIFGPSTGTTTITNTPTNYYIRSLTFAAGAPAYHLIYAGGIDFNITVQAGVTTDQYIEGNFGIPNYKQRDNIFANHGTGKLTISNGITSYVPWAGNPASLSFNGNGDFEIGAIRGRWNDGTSHDDLLNVVKNGSGTLTIADAADPYSTQSYGFNGSTTVNAGRLFVTNTQYSATGRGNVSVAANATLGGTGFITPIGAATVSLAAGSHLEPGTDDGNGTLTIGSAIDATTLTLGNNVTLAFDFDGPVHDAIRLHGDLVLSGNVNLVLRAVAELAPGIYTLLDYDANALNATEFNALTYNITGLPDTEDYLVVHDQENSQIHLQIIPSPAATALLLPALALLAQRRRLVAHAACSKH
jgi:hypothetical protein